MNKQTTTKQNIDTTVPSNFAKKVFNGKTENIMYFHEKNRHLVLVFTYNYQTNRGTYAGCMWRMTKPTPDKKEIPWNRKTHRQTAKKRFDDGNGIDFELPFMTNNREFYPVLRAFLRRSVIKNGVRVNNKPNVSSSSGGRLEDVSNMVSSSPSTKHTLAQFESALKMVSTLAAEVMTN